MDVKLRRCLNLRRWIDEDPVAQGNVRVWCDRYSQNLRKNEKPFTDNHIRQYVPASGKPQRGRGIGERLARKIERATGRQEYELDKEPGETVQDSQAAYRAPKTSAVQRAYDQAGPIEREVVDAVLGLKLTTDLPEGAGDAIRLALKLAKPGRKGRSGRDAA